jgi:spore coat protein H
VLLLLMACAGGGGPALTEPDGSDGAAAGSDAPDASGGASDGGQDGRPAEAGTSDASIDRVDAQPPDVTGPAHGAWGIPQSAAAFDDRLHDYAFTVAPGDWQWLNDNIALEQPVNAQLTVNGQSVGTVGLRYKGGLGTLYTCIDEQGRKLVDAEGLPLCPKLSFKVHFTFADPQKRFYGLKKINLHALTRDPTLLHERLAYQLFRQMGVAAPRSVHAQVTVNGQFLGVYALTEAVDGRFTKDRWPQDPDGNLYKETWPTDNDPKYYEEHLETNEDTMASHEDILSWARQLTATGAEPGTVMDRWTDLAYLTRYLAVDTAIRNADGITAFYCTAEGTFCSNHNFYWYATSDHRFWPIPWDLDYTWSVATTFDSVPGWTDTGTACGERYTVWSTAVVSPPGCDPVLRGAATRRTLYTEAMQLMLAGPMQTSKLQADIERWTAQISGAVSLDPTMGHDGWIDSVIRLQRDVSLLRERMEHLGNGRPLPERLTLSLEGVNDFESLSPLAFSMGLDSSSNRNSSRDHDLNRNNPVSGAADARLTWELRNDNADPSKGAWGQWVVFRFAFPDPLVDLRRLKQVRFKARADAAPRSIWVALESPRYADPDAGRLFGWSVGLETTADAHVLDIGALTQPSWDDSPPDDRDTVLGDVSALIVSINAEGLLETGVFPPGLTDRGALQMDDIELVFQE